MDFLGIPFSDSPVRSRVFIALACLCTAVPAAAQDSTPPDSTSAADSARRASDSTAKARRDRAQALDRVIVTERAARRAYGVMQSSSATKTDTPLRDTPQAVTVVTKGLIADQAMQSMADVSRYVPGVTMGGGEGHRDQPVIRGNSSTADFFVDGVRDDAQYLRDLYNAERIEAIKGANAMIFGRGGGGGVINRVSKDASWTPSREIILTGGSHDHRRGTLDVGQPIGRRFSARLNGMYENSGGFRDAADLHRWGINPTVAIMAGSRTSIRAGFERFSDERTVDRGIPSFEGAPSHADVTTFFGNPAVSHARALVDAASATVDRALGGSLMLRNRTRFTHYDKFYQNVYPGAVNATETEVALGAYNNATDRHNLFNQTDLTWTASTGRVRHTLLAGAELGRQATDNFRNTGYFHDSTTSVRVPFDHPTVSVPVTFRQSATDADNHVVARVGAAYLQDQVELSDHWQAIVGLRYDRFALDYHNDRDDSELSRDDRLVSPRAGLVFKPILPVSIYSGYGVSYLPSAGDQFSSLNATTETLEPERFTNYEVGAKWDVRPDLALTAAAYRLDRTNTSAKDPLDPNRTVQTGSQRTTGYEFGATGSLTSAWQLAGGYAVQRAVIVSTTTAAKAGATVPLVPHHTASLWNRWQLAPAIGAGLGVVHQARVYAAIDNAVTLPSFTRVDGALYLRLVGQLRAQLNVENLFDRRYYATAQGNNNIMPGATRTVRVALTTGL